MKTEPFALDGKVALVTGGGRGLGRAMTLGLARAGADVVIASRKLDACQDAAREVEDLGRRALATTCHVGDWAQCDALIAQAYERFGRVDVLVNNAGINPAAMPLADTPAELWDKIYAVNVRGPMRLASQASSRMAAHGGGSIINVITQGAFQPGANLGPYCSSKAALWALTQVMAKEWAPLGIRVNALAPGPFMTDMMRGGATIPGFLEGAAQATAMKRIAEPEEIVGATLFLASNASSYVTGESIAVTGGM